MMRFTPQTGQQSGFDLRGAAQSGRVDGWRLMLAARGIRCRSTDPQARPALRPNVGAPWVEDAEAVFAALPDLPPADSAAHAAVLRAMDRLDAIAPDAFPADLDLQIFAFRRSLDPLVALWPTAPQPGRDLTDADLNLAALMWRAALIAEGFGLFLLEGFTPLHALSQQILSEPALAGLLTPAHGRTVLAARRARVRPGAVVNWRPAVAPSENGFLRYGRKMEIPSIGRLHSLG